MLNGARTDDGGQTGLLLPQHLDHLLHLHHPIYHLDLKLLILVDAFSQLLSSLLSLLLILSSLPLHLYQPSLAHRMNLSPR